MTKETLILSLLFCSVFNFFELTAQCNCTTCPAPVGSFATVTDDIVISGLTNSQLGVNGQDICEVRLHLETDAIEEIEVTLVTPSGEQIELIPRDNPLGIGIGQGLVFEIGFVQCSSVADPDPGYPDVFDSGAYDPDMNMSYNGTYYPGDGGCLEDLSGPANGTYSIILQDFIPGDPHTLIDWEILFNDNTGSNCNSCGNCNPGDLDQIAADDVIACEGSSTLVFDNMSATFVGSPPSSATYGVTLFLVDVMTGVVQERADNIDLSGAAPGTYQICGLSYLLTDAGNLPSTTGGYTMTDVEQDILNGLYCGDVTNSCTMVTVEPNLPEPDITWPSPVCEGQQNMATINNFDPNVTYIFDVTSGSATISLDNTTGEITFTPSQGPVTICVSIDEDCDNGEVCNTLTLAPPPPTPQLDAVSGVCSGDDVVVTVTNAMTGDTYEWTVNGPGSITSNNNDQIDISTNGPGTLDVCAELLGECDTIEACITIEVSDPTPPSINAQAQYCLPSDVFNADSNGPFTSLQWEQVSGPGTITFNPPNALSTTWSADQEGTYVIRLTKDNNGCITTDEATIELLPEPIAPILDGPMAFCINDIATVTITNPDPSATYTWTISGPGSIVADNGDNVDVEITGSGTVEVCAETTNPCGTVSDCWMADVNLPDPPSANEDPLYCFPGGSFNGSTNGPADQINYVQTGGPGTIAFVDPSNIQTDWSVDQPGIYIVELSKTFDGCDTATTFTFEVVDVPMVNQTVTCSNGEVTIELVFSGGTPPYIIDGTAIPGNTYTHPPVPSGTSVTINYEDANGCDDLITIQENCPCETDAGTMDPTLIELCGDMEVATGVFNNDDNLDGNDVGEFILHTDGGANVGTIWDRNSTGVFSFQPGMDLGVTYFISRIVGNDDGSGQVDVNDPCFDIALGQPVIWYPDVAIDVVIESDPIACDQSLILEAIFTLDPSLTPTTQWSVLMAPNGGGASFSSNTNSITTVDFSEPGDYTIQYQLELGPCIYQDDITLTIDPEFVVSSEDIICDSNDGTYTVSFDITGGQPPYLVNGNTFSGTTFTSAPIIIGSMYSFTVEESSGCPPTDLSGVDNCGCVSDAGTMLTGPLSVCVDDFATTSVSGSMLDNNDIGVFILHDAPGNTLGTIWDENTTGSFGLVAGMNTGESYYISFVVGNDIGGTVDLNDPCLSISPGTEVVWIDQPFLGIGSDFSTCGGPDTIAVFSDPGSLVTWDYSVTSPMTDGILNDDDPLNFVFSEGSEGLHILEATAEIAGCSTTVQLQINVLPQGTVADVSENCTGSMYNVSFTISGGLPPYSVNGMTITGNSFISADFASGTPYSFVVEDDNGCQIANLSGSRNCDCDTDAGTITAMPLAFCGTDQIASVTTDGNAVLDGDDTTAYILHDAPGAGLGTVIAQNATGSFAFQPPMVTNTTYYISYAVGNQASDGSLDLSDPCLDISVGIPVTWYEDFDLNYPDSMAQCLDTITLTNYLISEGITTSVRVVSGPGMISNVGQDSMTLFYAFDEPGAYQIEIRNTRNQCSDIDTMAVEIQAPIELDFVDVDTCSNSVAVNNLVNGKRVAFSTLSTFDIIAQGDSSIIRSSTIASGMVIATASASLCNEVDTFDVTLTPPLALGQASFTCNADGSAAEVEVTWTGGNGSYSVNGMMTTDTTFIFNNVGTGGPFPIALSSGNCPEIRDTLNINCGCSNAPANLPTTLIELCSGEMIMSTFVNTGQLGAEDTLLVILHDGGASQIGSILDINNSPSFELDPAINYPDTLWMTPFVGPTDGSGAPLLGDSCAVLGTAQPIIRIPDAMLDVVAPSNLCIGNSANVTINHMGLSPATIVVTIAGVSDTFAISEGSQLDVPFTATDSLDIAVNVAYIDYPCPTMASDLVIEVNECGCSNAPANLPTTLIELCSGEMIMSTFANTGQLGAEDTLLVILHDGGASQIGSILDINNSPSFELDPAINYPDTLWMTPFVGPTDAAGAPLLGDSCAVLGTAQPVIQIPEAMLNVVAPLSICIGDSSRVSVRHVGVSPSTIEINIGGSITTRNISEGDLIEIPFVASDSINIPVSVTYVDYPCPTMASTQTVIVGDCSCDFYTYDVPAGLCNDGTVVDLSTWEISQRPAAYSLITGSATISGSNLTIDSDYEGIVEIEAAPQIASACDSTYTITFSVESERVAMLDQESLSVCPNNEGTIDLNQYLNNQSSGGGWSTGPEIDLETLSLGSNVFTYTVVGGDFCPSASTDFVVNQTPPLDYIITSNDPDCADDLGSIGIAIGDSTLLNSISLDGSLLDDNLIEELSSGSYLLTLSDVNNCIYNEEVEINEVEPIDINITSEFSSGEGESYLVRSEVSGGTGQYTYQWIVGTDSLPINSSQISIQLDEDTEVQLIVTDENGCQAEDLIIVRVNAQPTRWTMPNILNGNSSNNGSIRIPNHPDIAIVNTWNIYDRWGNLVFSTGDFDPAASVIEWNGDFKGKPVASGVYVYYIQYQTAGGRTEVASGDITVIR